MLPSTTDAMSKSVRVRILTLFSRWFSPLAHPSNSVSDASGYGRDKCGLGRVPQLMLFVYSSRESV